MPNILTWVEKYLASISRRVPITEAVETDELDNYGHKVKKLVPVVNQLGEEMTRLEFIMPPTVTDLCLFMGISRSTWYGWMQSADPEVTPELVRAGELMRSFLDRENLSRGGLRGVENALHWDHGVTTQEPAQTVPVTGGVEDYLRQLTEIGGGPAF